MMQAFRSSAKLIVVVFALLLIFWLLGELSGLSSGGLFSRTTAGVIEGQRVETRAYETAVQQALDQSRQSNPGQLSLEDIQRIRDQVWDQFVENYLVDKQMREYGITVSPDEVAQAIRTTPLPDIINNQQFQTDGKFDMAKYLAWLRSTQGLAFVPYLEAEYRDQIARAKLYRAITSDVFLSDAALWQKYRDQNEEVKVELVAIVPRAVVPDSAVPVTEQEIDQYYQTHQDDFDRPRMAYLSYVALPRLLNASDSAAALERARQVRQEIVDGAPFAEVAQRESSDSASAVNGGDLGQWTRGEFDPAFDSVAFRIPLNTLSQPVLSQFGYHLIEVTSRNGDKAKGRHILIPIQLAGEHRDRLDAQADTLEALGAERLDPAALDTVASALHLQILKAEPVQQGSQVQVGRYLVQDAGVWAFQAQKGETSSIIETPDAFFLFRLDSLQEAGVPPLNEIRPAVEQAVRDEKKWTRAREIGADLAKRVKEGSTLTQAADALGLPHRELGPFPRVNPPLPNPVLVGAAFSLQPGGHSGIIDTKDGLYMLKVLEHIKADSAAFLKDIDQFRVQAIREARQIRAQSYLAALRQDADIKDFRAQNSQTNAQIEAERVRAQGGQGRS
ncbi:MAG: SurA N-terminal domain-containing protein [Gemmatimonadales bacterium]